MKTNIRPTKNKDNSCYGCIFFMSYAEKYDDDQEPFELGDCTHPENMEKYDEYGDDLICDLFVKR